MNATPETVRCADGAEISATVYRAGDKAAGSVIIAAALGVPQGFYAALAQFLGAQGFNVITFDYRGTGESAAAGPTANMEQWGGLDIDAVLERASNLPGERLFLLGHSAGGQLFGLAPNSLKLDGVILVSSLIPWWRDFPRPWNLRLWVLLHLIMPLFSLGRRFPARRLGISSIDVPSSATRQWARWGRSREYLFDPKWGLDLQRYARFGFPALVCHIDDDHFAPLKAVRALLSHMPRMEAEFWHIDSSLAPSGTVGHMGFFRSKMESVYWSELAGWLKRQAEKPRPPVYD